MNPSKVLEYSSNIIFHKPVKNSKTGFEIIKIDNYKGPLVIDSPFLRIYGVKETYSQNESSKLLGYTIPVRLYGEEEEKFVDCMVFIRDICRRHLKGVYGEKIANKIKGIFYGFQFEGMGTRVWGSIYPRMFNVKLLKYSKQRDKILTRIAMRKLEKVKLALIIDSIYISKEEVSFQVTVHDIYVNPPNSPLTIPEESEEDEVFSSNCAVLTMSID